MLFQKYGIKKKYLEYASPFILDDLLKLKQTDAEFIIQDGQVDKYTKYMCKKVKTVKKAQIEEMSGN